MSLALAGQSMTAGARPADGVQAVAGSSGLGSRVEGAVFPTLADDALASVGLASEGAIDMVGLFVLGLSLIGAGRVLARRQVQKPDERRQTTPVERANTAPKASVVARHPFRRVAG